MFVQQGRRRFDERTNARQRVKDAADGHFQQPEKEM